jgi:hypothetical protein
MEQIERYFRSRFPDISDLEITWEVCSGGESMQDRPKGAELLNKIHKGDHLIVSKIDRGWRRLPDFSQVSEFLHRSGIGVHCIDENIDLSAPAGHSLVQVISALSKLERGLASERTQEARVFLKQEGRPYKVCPFGFQPYCCNCNTPMKLHPGGGNSMPGIPRPKHTVSAAHKNRICEKCGSLRKSNTIWRACRVDRKNLQTLLRWKESGLNNSQCQKAMTESRMRTKWGRLLKGQRQMRRMLAVAYDMRDRWRLDTDLALDEPFDPSFDDVSISGNSRNRGRTIAKRKSSSEPT